MAVIESTPTFKIQCDDSHWNIRLIREGNEVVFCLHYGDNDRPSHLAVLLIQDFLRMTERLTERE